MGRFLRAMRLKFGPNVEEWLEKYQHATTSSMPADNIPPLVDDADDTFDGPSATSLVDISTQRPTQNTVVETSNDPPLAGPNVGGLPHDSSIGESVANDIYIVQVQEGTDANSIPGSYATSFVPAATDLSPTFPLHLESIDFVLTTRDPDDISWIPIFEKAGFDVVDVAGDGSCGYYCIVLGLHEHGIILPQQEDTRSTPTRATMVNLRRSVRQYVDLNRKALWEKPIMQGYFLQKKAFDEACRHIFVKDKYSTLPSTYNYYTREKDDAIPHAEWFDVTFHGWLLAALFRVRIVVYAFVLEHNNATDRLSGSCLVHIFDGTDSNVLTLNASYDTVNGGPFDFVHSQDSIPFDIPTLNLPGRTPVISIVWLSDDRTTTPGTDTGTRHFLYLTRKVH
jgi:hypothetical protein